jgi:hypothetical protein
LTDGAIGGFEIDAKFGSQCSLAGNLLGVGIRANPSQDDLRNAVDFAHNGLAQGD